MGRTVHIHPVLLQLMSGLLFMAMSWTLAVVLLVALKFYKRVARRIQILNPVSYDLHLTTILLIFKNKVLDTHSTQSNQ